MRCVIDIDGVVADFPTAFDRWVEREYGYLPAPTNRWDWYRDYPDGDRLWAEFNEPDVLCRGLAEAVPYPEAVNGVRALAERYDVTFCTYRLPCTETVTKAWLGRHGLGGIPVVHAKDKASVGASLYVDDHPDTIASLRARGRNGVLMDRPWNQGWDLPRVYGWGDVLVEAARARGAISLSV